MSARSSPGCRRACAASGCAGSSSRRTTTTAPAFVLRETAVAGRPTASPLRLDLRAGGADRLQVRILKRRGPPLEAPLSIELPTVLSVAARRRSLSERERGAVALNAATFVNFA